MGVTNALYPFGFQYEDPKKPYAMEGFVNSPGRRQGPRILQVALQVLHAARLYQRLHAGRPRRLQVRPGGDADELVRLLPRPLQGREGRRRQDRLLRQSRREGREARSSAARASRSSPIRRTRTRRCSTSSGSPRADVQKKWWSLGGYSLPSRVLNDPGLRQDGAVRGRLPRSRWARSRTSGPSRPTPSCCSPMQKRVHDYVVADKGTAKEALDRARQGLAEGLQGRRQASEARSRGRPGVLLARDALAKLFRPASPRDEEWTHGLSSTAAAAMVDQSQPVADRAAAATPARRPPRARPLGPGDRLDLHRADDRPAAGDQHLPADLDDPALLHELPRQPAERAGAQCRHRELPSTS